METKWIKVWISNLKSKTIKIMIQIRNQIINMKKYIFKKMMMFLKMKLVIYRTKMIWIVNMNLIKAKIEWIQGILNELLIKHLGKILRFKWIKLDLINQTDNKSRCQAKLGFNKSEIVIQQVSKIEMFDRVLN